MVNNKKVHLSKKEVFIKNQKKRRKVTYFVILIFIVTLSIGFKKAYMYFSCKDLSSAVEYHMTSNKEIPLLRVQSMKLKFSNGDSAVVEAFGLTKEKPHESKSLECHLKKKNNYWKLENLYVLQQN